MKSNYYSKLAMVLLFFFVGSVMLSAEKPDQLVGKWLTQEQKSIVKIYKKNNKFYGKIVWLREENDKAGKPKTDDKNPDESKQSRKLMGLLLLRDFVFDGDDTWEDGEIYNPKEGKTYSCKITFDEKDKIKVRGYIGISLFGKTVYWTRVKKEKK